MSTIQTARSSTTRPRPDIWYPGVTALLVTKAGDVTTTVVGITLVDGLVEMNPIAAATLDVLGVLGLVLLGLAGVGIVVLSVETAVAALDSYRWTGVDPRVVYLFSYLPLSMVFATAAFYNAGLILGVG